MYAKFRLTISLVLGLVAATQRDAAAQLPRTMTETFEAALAVETWQLERAQIVDSSGRFGSKALQLERGSRVSVFVDNPESFQVWVRSRDSTDRFNLSARYRCRGDWSRPRNLLIAGDMASRNAAATYVQRTVTIRSEDACTIELTLQQHGSGAALLDDVTVTYLAPEYLDSVRVSRLVSSEVATQLSRNSRADLEGGVRAQPARLREATSRLAYLDTRVAGVNTASATVNATIKLSNLVNPLNYKAFTDAYDALDAVLARFSPRESGLLRSVHGRVQRFFARADSVIKRNPLQAVVRILSGVPVINTLATTMSSLFASRTMYREEIRRDVARLLRVSENQLDNTLDLFQEKSRIFFDSLLEDYAQLQELSAGSQAIVADGRTLRAHIDSVIVTVLTLADARSDSAAIAQLKRAAANGRRSPPLDTSALDSLGARLERGAAALVGDTNTARLGAYTEKARRISVVADGVQEQLDLLARRMDAYFRALHGFACSMRLNSVDNSYSSEYRALASDAAGLLNTAQTEFRGMLPDMTFDGDVTSAACGFGRPSG